MEERRERERDTGGAEVGGNGRANARENSMVGALLYVC